MSRRRWWAQPAARRLAVLVAVAGGTVPVLLSSPAKAEASFAAVAGANAVDVVASDAQDIPLIGAVKGGGTWGQATLDSNGHSSGFAAFPNPGASEAGAGALAGAPGDPLFLSAENGQPPADLSQPGLHLHAEAADTSARGYAIAGQEGAGSSRSEATVRQVANGSVLAVATTAADGLVVGPVTIGGIDGMASATRDASGRLTTVAHTAIAQIGVSGQSFGFRDGTFTAAGSSTPVPASTVLGALSAAGVEATYQEPEKSATGIISGTLLLRYSVPATPQTAPVQLTYKLGEADAAIGYSAIGGSGPTGGSTDWASAGGAGGATTGSSAGSGTGGSMPSATGVVPAVDPGGLAPSSGEGQSPSVATPSASPQTVALAGAGRTADPAWLYLAIVVAALVVFGAAHAVRLLGVKFLWTS
jgi:hypothetical protein